MAKATAIEQWSLMHERVAILGATGIAVEEIARVVERPEEWVEQVLNSDQALAVKEKYFIDLKHKLFAHFESEFIELMELSIRNVKRTLAHDIDPEIDWKSKVHQDKISIEIMKLARGAKESNRDLGTGLSLTREESLALVDSFKAAKEAENYADYEVVTPEKNGH